MDGFVKHFSTVKEMEMDGGARIRWLITHREGAQNFSMRLITIPRGKETPSHSHDYEHEIFVMEGRGKVLIGNEEREMGEGDFIFIPPNVFHRMKAGTDMRVICVVPIKAAKMILGD